MLEFSPYYIRDEIQMMSISLQSALGLADGPDDDDDIAGLDDDSDPEFDDFIGEEEEEDDTLGEDDPNDWDAQTDFEVVALQQDYIHSIRLSAIVFLSFFAVSTVSASPQFRENLRQMQERDKANWNSLSDYFEKQKEQKQEQEYQEQMMRTLKEQERYYHQRNQERR
jgi:hypothetical protein